MKSHRFTWLTYVCVSAALVGGLPFVGNTAVAAPILPGFDYFVTGPGGATVDLGMGPILLEGVPLPHMASGFTDTVVARKDTGPPPGGTGIIDIELVALHLKSVAPVDFDSGPGFAFGDLHVTIDASDRFFTSGLSGTTPHPDGSGTGPSYFDLPVLPSPVPIPPSTGNMRMMHDPPGPGHSGATMKACFGTPGPSGTCDAMPSGFGTGLGVPGGGIYATAIAVIPGGDPANPADWLPGTMPMPAPPVTLASMGDYLHTLMLPDEYGGVFLTTVMHDGPHPHAQPVMDSIDREVTPEPSSVVLMLVGILGCGLIGRRRNL